MITGNEGQSTGGIFCKVGGEVSFFEPSVFGNIKTETGFFSDLLDNSCFFVNSSLECEWNGVPGDIAQFCIDANCLRDACTVCDGDNSSCSRGCDLQPWSNKQDVTFCNGTTICGADPQSVGVCPEEDINFAVIIGVGAGAAAGLLALVVVIALVVVLVRRKNKQTRMIKENVEVEKSNIEEELVGADYRPIKLNQQSEITEQFLNILIASNEVKLNQKLGQG